MDGWPGLSARVKLATEFRSKLETHDKLLVSAKRSQVIPPGKSFRPLFRPRLRPQLHNHYPDDTSQPLPQSQLHNHNPDHNYITTTPTRPTTSIFTGEVGACHLMNLRLCCLSLANFLSRVHNIFYSSRPNSFSCLDTCPAFL